MLVSAAVICTHAEAFLGQTQNSLTFFEINFQFAYINLLGLAIICLTTSLTPVQCSL